MQIFSCKIFVVDTEHHSARKITRSQAVARIADRTASQHLRGSRDAIGHVTIFYWWSFRTESLNPAVFEILRSKRIGVTSLTF